MYSARVSRRRLRRKSEKAQRHAALTRGPAVTPPVVAHGTARVEPLAYTRTQAAATLGISRSTFNRRVLPFIETIETGWGTRLVPVDELTRFIAERRRPARAQAHPAAPGRPAALAPELVNHIRAEHADGRSLRQIARDLNATGTPTAHGGAQWWPSTVRAVLRRASG
jgi:hypothetical protein